MSRARCSLLAIFAILLVPLGGCPGDDPPKADPVVPSTFVVNVCITWAVSGDCLEQDDLEMPKKVWEFGEELADIHETSRLRNFNERLRQLEPRAFSAADRAALRELAQLDPHPGLAVAVWDDTLRLLKALAGVL